MPPGKKWAGLGCILAAAGLLGGACSTGEGTAGSSTTSTAAVVSASSGTTVATTTTTAPTTTSTTAPATTTTAPTTTTTSLPAWWRPVSTDDPLRVWVMGDSLAGSVGAGLSVLVRGQPMTLLAVDYEQGTGLARTDVFDWFDVAAERLPEVAPDVVVVSLGANDAQAIHCPQGVVEYGSTDWDVCYSAKVGRMMDQLLAGSTRVYWVGMPVMASLSYDRHIRHLNALLREQAALRLGVRFVDVYALFEGPNGGYAEELVNDQGNLEAMRLSDGVHFTSAGDRRLAGRVLEVIREDWIDPAGG
jgi:hypothetical protein